jgi:hypothetical protein
MEYICLAFGFLIGFLVPCYVFRYLIMAGKINNVARFLEIRKRFAEIDISKSNDKPK